LLIKIGIVDTSLNNFYGKNFINPANSLTDAAIIAQFRLFGITHLEKEPYLSPDRMCAVLLAKWIKISVVLRSVICI